MEDLPVIVVNRHIFCAGAQSFPPTLLRALCCFAGVCPGEFCRGQAGAEGRDVGAPEHMTV